MPGALLGCWLAAAAAWAIDRGQPLPAAALIAPVMEEDLRYVPEVVAIVYVVLAAASYLDWRSKQR